VIAALALLACFADAAARQRGPVQLEAALRMGTTYDTNLEHRPTGAGTFGLGTGGDVRLRLRTGRFAGSLQHAASVYRYEAMPDRNRTNHDSRVVVEFAASSAVTLSTTATASFGGLSEDREVGTAYGLVESLDVEVDGRNRVRFTAGYAQRRYGERSGRDAGNWALGIGYAIGSRAQPIMDIQSKFDRNETEDPRGAFRRWTHRVELRAPLGSSRLGIGVRRVAREYPQRLVELEEVRDLELAAADMAILDAYEQSTGRPRGSIPASELLPILSERWRNLPRRDEIWSPLARWTVTPNRTLEIELRYEYEVRLSTDLRRGYSGHTASLSSRLRL
jgi:hypothetical protein